MYILSFLTTKILSFSEFSKYRALDNKVVFIFNYVTCSTLSIFTWNTGWALPPTGLNKKLWEESINLDNAAVKVVPQLHFKLNWKLIVTIDFKKVLRDEFSILEFQFCTLLSRKRYSKTQTKAFTLLTPWANQTS